MQFGWRSIEVFRENKNKLDSFGEQIRHYYNEDSNPSQPTKHNVFKYNFWDKQLKKCYTTEEEIVDIYTKTLAKGSSSFSEIVGEFRATEIKENMLVDVDHLLYIFFFVYCIQ